MVALEIARVNLLRTLRERSNLFFVFLLPIILIVALGSLSGGLSTSRLGIVSVDAGMLGEELARGIEGSGELPIDVLAYPTVEGLRVAVEEDDVDAGLVIPRGYDEALRAGKGAQVTVVTRPEDRASTLRQAVVAAVAAQSARIRAARVASTHADVDFATALTRARVVQESLPGISLTMTSVGEAQFPSDIGRFGLGAQSQVILFMFLTSLTAATQLVLTRELGVSRRMLSTATPVRSILAGELLGRFAVAMVQGIFIVVVSATVFDVSWGNLPGATLVVVLFGLIGTGAALLIGVLARNPDQAGAIGVVVGLVLGAIGGAMIPAELFDEPISTVSRFTPHAWAIDALRDLAFRGAGIVDVLAQLAVLAGMAVLLVVLGLWGLRRSLTRA